MKKSFYIPFTKYLYCLPYALQNQLETAQLILSSTEDTDPFDCNLFTPKWYQLAVDVLKGQLWVQVLFMTSQARKKILVKKEIKSLQVLFFFSFFFFLHKQMTESFFFFSKMTMDRFLPYLEKKKPYVRAKALLKNCIFDFLSFAGTRAIDPCNTLIGCSLNQHIKKTFNPSDELQSSSSFSNTGRFSFFK